MRTHNVMEVAQHIDAVQMQGNALTAAADRVGLDAVVPSCPGWTVRDLLAHVGMVHRWAATHVQEGQAATADGHPELATAPDDGVLAWFADGHAELVTALSNAPADLDCWTFLPAPSPLAFWARRQAHETAIHRADAEEAGRSVAGYPVGFAVDGIGELVTGFMGPRGGKLVADQPCSLLIAPTDAVQRWHVLIGPDGRTIAVGEDRPADCTVAATASDLYLFLWNRQPVQRPAVLGAQHVLDLWRDKATVQWR